MLTGLDHLVIACHDPDAAVQELELVLGLAPNGGGRHDRLGTYNRLVWLGDTYLELIGVFDRELAEASWVGAPTVRRLETGSGLATWAVTSDALEADVELLRARGSDLGDPMPGERTRPDGRVVRWRLATPRRLGPADPPFLIEHDPTAAEWTPTERAERASLRHPLGGAVRLDVLEIPVADTHRASTRFLAGAGIGPFRPSLAGRGARDAVVGSQTLRLRPDPRPDARPTIHLRAVRGDDSRGGGDSRGGDDSRGGGDSRGASADEVGRDVELLGCRWIVRPG